MKNLFRDKPFASFIIPLIFTSASVFGQTGPAKYWVEFTDKNNNAYSIDNPSEFLSERAIERREKQGIEITENDLPVSQVYIDSLETLGIEVRYTSKWFNAATVKSTDIALLDTLDKLDFVKNGVFDYFIKEKKDDNTDFPQQVSKKKPRRKYVRPAPNFDYHDIQLTMLNGDLLHEQGLKGQGMLIAVIDGGFLAVDKMPAFETLRNENRIIALRNFVDDTIDLYRSGSHGMKVLSTMAGDIEGQLIGTAPLAQYVLIQSENGSSEYSVEADNWIAAIEYADSIGADVVNSSLGYHNFDDDRQDLTYEDLNGVTMRNSLAADMAFEKGLLVVTSAGNQGNKAWKYITTPADAFNVLTVGAVGPDRGYAPFSSVGPTADGRIKPNVCALGYGTFVQQLDSSINTGNGTSYSSPVMAGMCACLWQAFPEATNREIKDAIEHSASQYNNPDSLLGYGIPDFLKAQLLLNDVDSGEIEVSKNEQMQVIPNPFHNSLYIEVANIRDTLSTKLKVFSANGKKVYQEKIELFPGNNLISLNDLSVLAPGPYLVQIKTNNKTLKATVLKY